MQLGNVFPATYNIIYIATYNTDYIDIKRLIANDVGRIQI